MASIVDKPKGSGQDDLLEIEKYTNGLVKFISTSATPITIGIQGEWGSGKTSLLNTIKEDLCDKENSLFYPIWLNTWSYSLLSTLDETLIKIVTGLVAKIGKITENKATEKGKKAMRSIGSLLKTFGGFGGIAGKAAQIAGEVIDATVNKEQDNSIEALNQALQDVINDAISSSSKKSFIFFIDDLDRLDPTVAVNILELIKNLFDLKNCIFVLAIDYGVVIKGLQSKFGVMTEENEWEFRAFFDKIIQLPFSMPLSSYNIGKYLKSLLVDVKYFAEDDLNDEKKLEKITEIVGLSVGTNPRALKRLANSVSLIEIIRGDEKITTEERVIEFALMCIQIAYPFIYGLIQKESDFTNWSEQLIYNVLKNKKIDDKDLEALKDEEEFDEEWEQNLWRVCQVSSFLKQRAYQLSKLLNFIKDNIPKNEDEDMKETIDRLLSMSSVTSVSAESVASSSKEKYGRTQYENWEKYIDSELIKDKNLPRNILDETKDIIKMIKENFGDACEVRYTPSFIGFRNKNAKGRQKIFTVLRMKQKGVELELNDIFGDLAEKLPHGRVNKIKYFYFFVTKNSFEEKYFPYVKERFEYL